MSAVARHRPLYVTGSSRRQRGFTLVEVVVALTIFSLIMLATVSAFRTLANSRTTLDGMTERIDEIRLVSGFLRGALQSTAPSERVGGLTLGGSGDSSSHFAGSPDAVEWSAPLVFGEAYGGRFMLRLAREEGVLALRWLPPSHPGAQLDWTRSEMRPLVQGLEEFSLQYRGTYGGTWHDVWTPLDPPSTLKMLIKADGRYWPEIIVNLP